MKLVSYLKEDHAQLAFLVDGILYDSDRLHPDYARNHDYVFKLLGRHFSYRSFY